MLEYSDGLWMKKASQILLAILIIQTTAFGGAFVATQEQVIFAGNLTLVVEDVDPSSGVVWLKLCGEDGTIKSEVYRVGERFAYDEGGIELTIANIYAGDESDLVEFDVIRGEMSKKPTQNVSDTVENSKAPEKSPGFDAVPIAILALAMIVHRLIKAQRRR